MMIKLCSKPQHFDAVTPTPPAHRSHSCMRTLALAFDTAVDANEEFAMWILNLCMSASRVHAEKRISKALFVHYAELSANNVSSCSLKSCTDRGSLDCFDLCMNAFKIGPWWL